MKYAVIGASGQLGRDLCPRLGGEVIAFTRGQADLTQKEKLQAAIAGAQADMVINCAAYNFVDKAETEPEAACAVNAWGVGHLADICAGLNKTLVHFSTDYVFGLDGSRGQPYVESDAPGPISVYGLSKLAGEYQVRSRCPRHFVIRTCGLYGVWGSGGKGGNFVETMLRVASQGKPLRVVADQICTPSYTVDIASAACALIQTGKFGLYQLTNSGSCSWYEFAQMIVQKAGVRADIAPISSKDYGAAARRPAYSVLSAKAYESLGNGPIRDWPEALAAYLLERQKKGKS